MRTKLGICLMIVIALTALAIMLSGCEQLAMQAEQVGGPPPAEQQVTTPTTTPTQPTAPPAVGAYHTEDISFAEFPTAKAATLEKGRYSIYFETDYPIQFVVYSEQRYNQWKEEGAHTISKATTKSGSSCCAESGTFTVDINEGEQGTYYFVFDNSRVSNNPTTGKIIVTKLGGI